VAVAAAMRRGTLRGVAPAGLAAGAALAAAAGLATAARLPRR
jgi:hypothetical protein